MAELYRNPKHKYDCGNCKFNWCCGYTCSCKLTSLPDEPQWLKKQLEAIQKLLNENSDLIDRGLTTIDKFKTKNEENIDKLNKFIECRFAEIQVIVVSPVMFEYLKLLDGSDYNSNTELLIFRGKRVITDAYLQTHQIYFTMKYDRIDFELPCICGIYNDEKHS